MLERFQPVLRLVCLALAGLVLYQLTRLAARRDPLRDLSFAAAAKASVSPESPKTGKGTNAMPNRSAARKEDLPPVMQARIDRITQSELLGPVMRPQPMALLGIAGANAFIRAPNGQTGLMRVGEELGGIKLLQIGTNRVLVEEQQQTKELMIFSGLGSTTLLPKGKEPSP